MSSDHFSSRGSELAQVLNQDCAFLRLCTLVCTHQAQTFRAEHCSCHSHDNHTAHSTSASSAAMLHNCVSHDVCYLLVLSLAPHNKQLRMPLKLHVCMLPHEDTETGTCLHTVISVDCRHSVNVSLCDTCKTLLTRLSKTPKPQSAMSWCRRMLR